MEAEKKDEEPEVLYCRNCSEEVASGDVLKNEDGEIYCEDCYCDKYFNCHDCDEESYVSGSRYINEDYRVCSDCADNYSYCENCGDISSDDYYGDDLCISCHRSDDDDNGGERRYSEGLEYASEKGRMYAVEIETNFDSIRDRRELFNALPRAVGITRDGSLGNNGVELQTPKLNGTAGDELLKKICKHLNENRFTVDRQCGLHVHIDTSDFYTVKKESLRDYSREYNDLSQSEIRRYQERDIARQVLERIKTLLLFYIAYEQVIYSFMPMTRRTNRYCFPLSEFYHEQEIINCDTIEKLESLWYREQSREGVENRKKEKYDNSRYAGYNFHSMLANKHIECRHHSGTQDYNKIRNWIDLNIMILDNVVSGRVKMSELKTVKHAIDIKQKTKMFFEVLGVSRKLKTYFLARQKKFTNGNIAKQSLCVE